MFCPDCGSTDKEMIDGVCIDCFLKNFNMIEIPETISVTICKHCNSRLEEGKWSESNLIEEEIIYRTLERNITINTPTKNEIIDLEIVQIKGTTAKCSVIAKGDVYDVPISEEHEVDVKIKRTVCPTCSKIQSGYYESVIQFRADTREIKAEEFEIADTIVNKTLNNQYKNDKLAYCPQVAKLKEGKDYYIGSLKSGRKVANALKYEFGGVIKESPRLISEDKSTGKGLYRIWISVRIPEFEIGDFVKNEDKILQIKDIGKNRVLGLDIKTNKNHTLTNEKLEVVKKSEAIEKVDVISKSPSTIQILDPADYSVVDLEVKDWLEDVKVGDKLNIVKIDDYYILKWFLWMLTKKLK